MRCPHCWGEQWLKCDRSGGASSAQLSLSLAIAQREHNFFFFNLFIFGWEASSLFAPIGISGW